MVANWPHAFLLLSASSLVFGCGSSSDDGATTSTSSSSSGGGPEACIPESGAAGAELTGRFAYRELRTLLVSLPGYAEPLPTAIENILLVDQVQSGADVTLTSTFCSHTIEDEKLPAHITVPATFVASLPPFTREGTISATGDYDLPTFFRLEGVNLTNVEAEALPETSDDARVYDQDNDGKPGLTLIVTGLVDGEMYVIERSSTALSGKAISSDVVEGALTVSSEQVVLGSDPTNLKDLTKPGVADPTECASYFRMVRIADDADCAFVTANKGTLFP